MERLFWRDKWDVLNVPLKKSLAALYAADSYSNLYPSVSGVPLKKSLAALYAAICSKKRIMVISSSYVDVKIPSCSSQSSVTLRMPSMYSSSFFML